MAVIIKGRSIRCAQISRDHYMRGPENQRITVLEVKGFATQDADEALTMLELSAKGTKCQKPVYSAKVNPEPDQRWTPEERDQAIDLLEKNLGLTGYARVVVEHLKKDRIHYHVFWSRFPPEGGPAKNMGNDYAIHQKTQKEIEQAYKLRPMMAKGRDFKQGEVEWLKRYGFDIFKLRDEITNAFNTAKSGQDFKAALDAKGIVLCRGDKSQFVLILPWGQHKALSSMILGRPTKAVLRRSLGDIDISKLPTVQEGKAQVTANLPKISRAKRNASAKGKLNKSRTGGKAHTYIRNSRAEKRKAKITSAWQQTGIFVASRDASRLAPAATGMAENRNTGVDGVDPVTATSSTAAAATPQKPQGLGTSPSTGGASDGQRKTSGSLGAAASLQGLPLPAWLVRYKEAKEEKSAPQGPSRPSKPPNMSEEQWSDYLAACDKKITWAEYYRKWGGGGAPSPS